MKFKIAAIVWVTFWVSGGIFEIGEIKDCSQANIKDWWSVLYIFVFVSLPTLLGYGAGIDDIMSEIRK